MTQNLNPITPLAWPSVPQLLAILRRHLALVLVLPLALGLAAYLASLRLPNMYRSTVLLAVTTPTPTSVLKGMADSDLVRDAVAQKVQLGQHYGVADPAQVALRFRGRVSSHIVPRDNGVLAVSATDTDAAFAARLAEAVAQETKAATHRALLTASSVALSALLARQQQADRDAQAGVERLKQAGVKDWRVAMRPSEAALLSLIADVQADINLRGGNPQLRENSTMLLQLRMAALMQLAEKGNMRNSLPAEVAEKVADQFYLSALRKRLAVLIELAQNDVTNEIRLAGPAPVPLTRESPNRLVIAIAGAAAGFGLAVLIALWRGLRPARRR